jgi:hypothetical protein
LFVVFLFLTTPNNNITRQSLAIFIPGVKSLCLNEKKKNVEGWNKSFMYYSSRNGARVAAADVVNRTPSPNLHLKCFTERVIKARQPPLLELHNVTAHDRRTLYVLPKRSKLIAA